MKRPYLSTLKQSGKFAVLMLEFHKDDPEKVTLRDWEPSDDKRASTNFFKTMTKEAAEDVKEQKEILHVVAQVEPGEEDLTILNIEAFGSTAAWRNKMVKKYTEAPNDLAAKRAARQPRKAAADKGEPEKKRTHAKSTDAPEPAAPPKPTVKKAAEAPVRKARKKNPAAEVAKKVVTSAGKKRRVRKPVAA